MGPIWLTITSNNWNLGIGLIAAALEFWLSSPWAECRELSEEFE